MCAWHCAATLAPGAHIAAQLECCCLRAAYNVELFHQLARHTACKLARRAGCLGAPLAPASQRLQAWIMLLLFLLLLFLPATHTAPHTISFTPTDPLAPPPLDTHTQPTRNSPASGAGLAPAGPVLPPGWALSAPPHQGTCSAAA